MDKKNRIIQRASQKKIKNKQLTFTVDEKLASTFGGAAEVFKVSNVSLFKALVEDFVESVSENERQEIEKRAKKKVRISVPTDELKKWQENHEIVYKYKASPQNPKATVKSKEIGKKVRSLRRQRDWSQGKLAEELAKVSKSGKCSQQLVAAIEKGRPLGLVAAVNLAKVLGGKPEEFLSSD